jgi:drug/metabolite transporter (DMT)-like permease
MFSALSPTYKGLLLGLAGYSLFTVVDMLVKFVSPTYSVYQIIVSVDIVSVLILLILSPWLGGIKSAGDLSNLKLHVLRGIIGVALGLISTYSFANLPMTTVYTAIFSQPFFAVIFAALIYREKTSMNRWLTIFVGFTGVLIAFRPWNNDIPLTLLSVLFVFPFIIAAMYVVMRSLKSPSLFAIGIYPYMIALFAMLPFAVHDFPIPTLTHIAIFIVMGVFGVIGFLFLSTSYRIAAASVAGSTHYVQMLWGLIWGYFIFGEVPDGQMMIGAAIIIASGIYLILQERKESN